MTNFKGAAPDRDRRPQTTKNNAARTIRNGDVTGTAAGKCTRGVGNRGWLGGGNRPAGK